LPALRSWGDAGRDLFFVGRTAAALAGAFDALGVARRPPFELSLLASRRPGPPVALVPSSVRHSAMPPVSPSLFGTMVASDGNGKAGLTKRLAG
jgi:hypothetical protein